LSLRFRSQLSVDLMPDEQIDNRWEVIMPKMNLKTSIVDYPYYPIVESIHFAPLGFKNSTNVRAVTTYYNIPVDKEDAKEANITMYCDTGMLAQYYIAAWKELMFDQKHEYYYYPWQYKKDIVVLFFGAGSAAPTARFLLKGCYPIIQNDFELQYTRDPKRLRITQKFNVDRVVYDPAYSTSAIISTFASGNPLGILSDTALAAATDRAFGTATSWFGGDNFESDKNFSYNGSPIN